MARNPLQLGPDDSDNALANAPLSILDPNAAPMTSPGQAVATTYDAVGEWLAQQRAKSAQMGMWDDRTGLPTQAGLLDAIRQAGTAVALGTGGAPERPGFTAYHGSPHLFPPTEANPLGAFDPAKIGTGEGAQTYGVGAGYLAEREGVAKTYKNVGDDRPVVEAQEEFYRTYRDLGNAVNADKSTYDAALKSHEDASKALEAARASRGHMYEVQVNADPERFLHWEKPLSEQHPDVQKALEKLGYGPGDHSHVVSVRGPDANEQWVLPNKAAAEAEAAKWREFGDYEVETWEATHEAPWTGERVLRDMQGNPRFKTRGSESAALSDAGIPGIRYLDAGSRPAGEGSHNLVVFDPATMEIIRRYGLAGLMAGGGAAALGGQPAQANPLLQGAR